MPKFATNTSVSVEKSRAEIETVLSRYGAKEFGYMMGQDRAQIAFATASRKVKFTLPLPDKNGKEFKYTPHRRNLRSQDSQLEAWEQACRQRWRALLLAIKAKLESVDCGISTFEQEFMAFIVDPVTGQTIGEHLAPMIEARYQHPATSSPLALPAPQD